MKNTKGFFDIVKDCEVNTSDVSPLRHCLIVGLEWKIALRVACIVQDKIDGKLDLIRISMTGNPSVDRNSEDLLMKETDEEVHSAIGCPQMLRLSRNDLAQED